MKRLAQIEYLKNFSYKPFKVFIIIYFLILLFLLFIGLKDLHLGGITLNLKKEGIYKFPQLWNFTTYILSCLKILLGCIIVFSITQEFSNRTFKQNIIDGLSKKEFLASKLLTISIFTIFSTIIVLLISLFLGYQFSDNTSSDVVYKEIYFVPNYFLEVFTFLTFLMFLSFLLRNPIFVFFSYFLLYIIEIIMVEIEYYFTFKNDPKMYKNAEALLNNTFISDYLPLENMSKLIPMPFLRTQMGKLFGKEQVYEYPIDNVIVCVVYCALFILGSYYIIKKRDW